MSTPSWARSADQPPLWQQPPMEHPLPGQLPLEEEPGDWEPYDDSPTQAVPVVPPMSEGPRHAAEPAPKPTPSSEPVVIAHAVTVILAAIVSAGWAVIPSDNINTIGSVVALAVASVGAVLARGRVTPLKGGIGGYISEVVRTELNKYPDGRQ